MAGWLCCAAFLLLSDQYERKYEGLLKEVRNLEGTLADYNLAMDKLRTSTDPEEVRGYHRQVREGGADDEAGETDRQG